MRASLLRLTRCPECAGSLSSFPLRDAREPGAGGEAEIEAGILACDRCHRWFPILDAIPELLPDHLREPSRDRARLDACGAAVPGEVHAGLRDPDYAAPTSDEGAHYKRAEISIASKIDDPESFFGPGSSAPFNPGNTEFTFYLIKLFANVLTLLDLPKDRPAVAIDSGCGYAWTTEWLFRSGVNAVGVDICREYLEIAVRRMGSARPHVIVADAEHLPFAPAAADAVLAFEAFHHIPDRARALARYADALKDGGVVVLAEPGAIHDRAPVSVETMSKYGILEKGMEIEDVERYVAGLPFDPPEYHYILHGSAADLAEGLTLENAGRHAVLHGHLFRLRKDTAAVAGPPGAARSAARTGRVSTAASELDAIERDHARLVEEKDAHLARAAEDVRRLGGELAEARAEIAAMRSSAFWKARAAWRRIADKLPFRQP